MTVYREKILLTYKYLITVHEELLTRTINVGMTGELAEVNWVFQVEDIYNFDVEQFRGTKDTNLNKLVAFYVKLENLMNSLANIMRLLSRSWRRWKIRAMRKNSSV